MKSTFHEVRNTNGDALAERRHRFEAVHYIEDAINAGADEENLQLVRVTYTRNEHGTETDEKIIDWRSEQ